MNPLVILSGGKDALLARETFVTDLYIYSYFEKGCRKSARDNPVWVILSALFFKEI